MNTKNVHRMPSVPLYTNFQGQARTKTAFCLVKTFQSRYFLVSSGHKLRGHKYGCRSMCF